MTENGKMMLNMEKEHIILMMVESTKENGKMMLEMGKEFFMI